MLNVGEMHKIINEHTLRQNLCFVFFLTIATFLPPLSDSALYSDACEICDISNIYITVLDIERIQRSPLIDSECAILFTISEEVRFKDGVKDWREGRKKVTKFIRVRERRARVLLSCAREIIGNNRAQESHLRIVRVARIFAMATT